MTNPCKNDEQNHVGDPAKTSQMLAESILHKKSK